MSEPAIEKKKKVNLILAAHYELTDNVAKLKVHVDYYNYKTNVPESSTLNVLPFRNINPEQPGPFLFPLVSSHSPSSERLPVSSSLSTFLPCN